jgi:predicted nucleotidyltransferase
MVIAMKVSAEHRHGNRGPRALTTAEQRALKRFGTAMQSLLGGNLQSLLLFGSRARGEGTSDSDLDVLVVLRSKDRAICRRIVEAALDVDLAYAVTLSPTILSEDELEQNRRYLTPFYRNVEHDSFRL